MTALPAPAREIPLQNDKVALVSECDYERVNQYKWTIDGNGYVVRMESYYDAQGNRRRRKIMLHRFIMDAPPGTEVDHAHHNKLDNRREALRVTTRYYNQWNSRPRKGSTSRYKGVHWDKRDKRWCAEIRVMGKKHYLGRFATEEEAALAYDRKAVELVGPMAFLNFPEHRHLYQLSLSIQRLRRPITAITA